MKADSKHFVHLNASLVKKTLTLVLVTVAAAACYSRRVSQGTHLNADLISAETKSCGMLVTLGESLSSGLDHEVPLQLQAVVCGDDGVDPLNLWHAIGAGVERQEVFVQQGSSQAYRARAVVKGGRDVQLLDPAKGQRIPLGTVEADEFYMPVKLNPGITAEFRSKGIAVPTSQLKSVPTDELEFWIIIGG